MPTYYPQEAGDVITLVLVGLAAIIAIGSWLAGQYDLRNPLPYDEVEQPTPVLRDVPDQAPIAAEHCSKVNAKRAEVRNG